MRNPEWNEKENGELSWGNSSVPYLEISEKKLKKVNKRYKKLQKKKRKQFMEAYPKWHTIDKADYIHTDLQMAIEEKMGNWTYDENKGKE